jgi:hypothetical protein
MARAEKEGCHAVLVKPIDAADFLAEVRELLGIR